MGCAIPPRVDFDRMRQRNTSKLRLDRMKRISLAITAVALTLAPRGARSQDTTAVDTSYVEYSDKPISLPLGIGLRVPTYDRVNGATIPWGPVIETSNGRIDADLLVKYRSHL